MFGGLTNGQSGYPVFHEEHQSQYDMSALPQLQLFQKLPVGCTIDNINFVGNDNATALSRPVKRARELEPEFTQQKLQRSFNNLCQEDTDLTKTTMNPIHVSTGLKLSYGDDERNYSITSVNENLRALPPVAHSLSNSIQLELDCQNKILDHYVKVQSFEFGNGMAKLKGHVLLAHTANLYLSPGTSPATPPAASSLETPSAASATLTRPIHDPRFTAHTSACFDRETEEKKRKEELPFPFSGESLLLRAPSPVNSFSHEYTATGQPSLARQHRRRLPFLRRLISRRTCMMLSYLVSFLVTRWIPAAAVAGSYYSLS
ncbi:hypothetical protein E3N88_39417 [Mikania micrantha]|uniref:Uncharacterized protein n=1 Tax=Mikania micrantha TaxID=192012 RepID=A0A5N6LWY3_9ASTR|nr:hypothetical protein E3N88_39417 [Mikania micrantha]